MSKKTHVLSIVKPQNGELVSDRGSTPSGGCTPQNRTRADRTPGPPGDFGTDPLQVCHAKISDGAFRVWCEIQQHCVKRSSWVFTWWYLASLLNRSSDTVRRQARELEEKRFLLIEAVVENGVSKGVRLTPLVDGELFWVWHGGVEAARKNVSHDVSHKTANVSHENVANTTRPSSKSATHYQMISDQMNLTYFNTQARRAPCDITLWKSEIENQAAEIRENLDECHQLIRHIAHEYEPDDFREHIIQNTYPADELEKCVNDLLSKQQTSITDLKPRFATWLRRRIEYQWRDYNVEKGAFLFP